MPVGLGVDGSASNDSGDLLAEARQAMLLARLAAAPTDPDTSDATPLLPARAALEMATLGGAAVLGRDDVGALAPGMAADIAAFDLSAVAYAGALHDPVAALLLCAPTPAAHTWVGGRAVVTDGQPVTVDVPALVSRHNRAAARLVAGG